MLMTLNLEYFHVLKQPCRMLTTKFLTCSLEYMLSLFYSICLFDFPPFMNYFHSMIWDQWHPSRWLQQTSTINNPGDAIRQNGVAGPLEAQRPVAYKANSQVKAVRLNISINTSKLKWNIVINNPDNSHKRRNTGVE